MREITKFALSSIKSVNVPINPTIPTEKVAYILDNTDIKYAIVENEEQFKKVKDSGVQLEKIIMMFSSQSSEHLPFTEVEELGKKHRSEEHTSELQSRGQLVCRLLLGKKMR